VAESLEFFCLIKSQVPAFPHRRVFALCGKRSASGSIRLAPDQIPRCPLTSVPIHSLVSNPRQRVDHAQRVLYMQPFIVNLWHPALCLSSIALRSLTSVGQFILFLPFVVSRESAVAQSITTTQPCYQGFAGSFIVHNHKTFRNVIA